MVTWKCCICKNIFYFNNNNQRLEFMREHATYCCKLIYPNGVTAYVGPANININTSINQMLSITNTEQNKVNYLIPTSPINTNTDNKPWITIPERIGYATAKLLVLLRDMYNVLLEQELQSLTYKEEEALITELDREKAVKIYCTRNNLVDTVKRIVHIDDLLYYILVDDDQIIRTMSYSTSDTGKRQYYIHTNSRNMYARQLACALRRLDKSTYYIDTTYNTNNVNI